MRKVFEVELASEDRCTELILPASPYALLDALEKLELREGEVPQWEVIQTHSCDKLYPYLDQDGTLSELNALCQQLALLDGQQTAIVEGLVKIEFEKGNRPVPMSQLIDMAYSTDCCHVVEEATNDYTLGRSCAKNGFVPDADNLTDQQFELLDFARIGREFRQNEGGVFTSGGYVQRHDELKQVYKTLDLTLKKPDYAILAELPDGSRARLPTPPGETMADTPARCVDCAAPALNGLTAMRSTLDMLARRLAELELDGDLTRYKAVLEATGCDDISQALALADDLDRYRFDPEPREPDEVASGHLKGLLSEEDLAALLSNVNLYCYGQELVEQSGGKLTGYGYVRPILEQTMEYGPAGAPIEAQRSGFDGERNHSEMNELSPQGGSEGYEACGDEMEMM